MREDIEKACVSFVDLSGRGDVDVFVRCTCG